MEYYSGLKKKKILPNVTTWIKLEGIMLRNRLGREDKGKYYKILFICKIQKKVKLMETELNGDC